MNIVMVVDANKRLTIEEYQRYAVYFPLASEGLEEAHFWDCSHIAFYANDKVDQRVPVIEHRVAKVFLTDEGVNKLTQEAVGVRQDLLEIIDRLRKVVQQLREDEYIYEEYPTNARWGHWYQVFFLSKADDTKTVILDQEVINDLPALTPGFVTLSSMLNATKTSELKNC